MFVCVGDAADKEGSLLSAQTSVEEGEGDGSKASIAVIPVSTKKPGVVQFPQDLPAMQVDCGNFHTGTQTHTDYRFPF